MGQKFQSKIRSAFDFFAHQSPEPTIHNPVIPQGYTKISHLVGPPNLVISKERERAYREVLTKHGIQIYPELIIECAYGISDEGFKVTEALLKNGKTN